MAVLGCRMIGRVMLVPAAAVEIACSGPHARPDEGSRRHATLGDGRDGCAAQCAYAGAAQRALLGCGHIGTTTETNGGDHGHDGKSKSHETSSTRPARWPVDSPRWTLDAKAKSVGTAVQ